MGSASFAAVTAAALIVLSCPVASRASILPQIQDANALKKEMGPALQVPVLREHYVEVEPGVFVAVKGARERRQVRFARLINMFGDDRLEVYERMGFPPFRHFEQAGGARTEHWAYPDKQVTYVFRGNDLVTVSGF
jgi:hypothetical protein